MKFGIFDHMDRGTVPLGEQYENRLKLIEAQTKAVADAQYALTKADQAQADAVTALAKARQAASAEDQGKAGLGVSEASK